MNLVAAAVIVPLLAAIALLVSRRSPRAQQALSLIGAVALLLVAIGLVAATAPGEVLVLAVGSWGPLAGIVWVVDKLSATMITLAATVSLATIVYAPGGLRTSESRFYHPLHHLVVAGVGGCFVTGDLFNLFVFFEVMLVASFALISLGGRPRQLNLTFPYVVINLVASGLFFAGVGMVYGALGTVNMAELASRVGTAGSGTVQPAFALVFVAFAIKAGVVPFFFWLPDAYPESPLPAGALFAGLLTKVGVYVLFRTVPLFGHGSELLTQVLLGVAAVTMVAGVLGALGRNTIRSILSFHIISQVGYMVFGLAVATPLAVAGGIFYVIHHIIVKSALFLAGGVVERLAPPRGELGAVSGLARTEPALAVAFLLPALSLAGIPPFSGFFAKLFVLYGGFAKGAWVVSSIAVLVSFLTLASMLKIWASVFWGVPVRTGSKGHGVDSARYHGQDGPRGHGADGPRGHGADGPRGHGADGPRGHGADGPRGHGTDGPRGHGADGPRGHGADGPRGHGVDGPRGRGLGIPVGAALALALLSTAIGLTAAPVFRWSTAAAQDLLAREPYTRAVLSVAAPRGRVSSTEGQP